MENSAEFYYEKLKNDEKPGNILAAMYSSLYGIPITRSEIIMCNRLISVFGRFTVFFSILDMTGTYPQQPENPYPLLYTICKRRFEGAHVDSIIQSRENLGAFITKLDKDIQQLKKSKIKFPSSKGLE